MVARERTRFEHGYSQLKLTRAHPARANARAPGLMVARGRARFGPKVSASGATGARLEARERLRRDIK